MNRCIKEYLNNKTVILVTHQLQFLTKADKIVVLKEGEAIAIGSYDQLINSSLDFLAFLEKEKEEEERKESLVKGKLLSINYRANGGDDSVGKSFDSTSPFKKQVSRTISMSRSRTSSLSGSSIQGEEEVMDEVDLGQGMTREEKAQDGSISARVYWDYLRKLVKLTH